MPSGFKQLQQAPTTSRSGSATPRCSRRVWRLSSVPQPKSLQSLPMGQPRRNDSADLSIVSAANLCSPATPLALKTNKDSHHGTEILLGFHDMPFPRKPCAETVRFFCHEDLVASSPNPRRTFDEERLEELAESIRSKGVLSPLLTRKVMT